MVISAAPQSSTSVLVTFSHRIAPASLQADGSQFTIQGLTVSAASLAANGTDVTLTTSAQGSSMYTVVAANTVTDIHGTGVGMPNSAMFSGFACTPNAIVISQVYGGGGNTGATFENDFVELHNRSSATVYLGGTSIQYQSTGGTTWTAANTTVLPDAGVAPGGYFLVQMAAGANPATALPTPDFDGGIAMASGAGKVAFVNSQAPLTSACPLDGGLIIDFVAYGAGNNCVQAGNTTTLTNTTSAQRASSACTDSNNDTADFTAATPVPRNSASTANTCSCP